MDWQYLDLADFLLIAEAVLASQLIRNHPLSDGNKRVGYLCALEFVARNGGTWTHPPDAPEGDETVAVIEGAARSSSEAQAAQFDPLHR